MRRGIRRVMRVKSCNSSKNQECFAARKGSRSGRKRRSRSYKPRISRPRRVSKRRSKRSKRRSRRSSRSRRVRSRVIKRHPIRRRSRSRRRRRSSRKSRRRSRSRSVSRHKGFVLSKSKDMGTQIKNFFKIDQEIVYMIQHPRKAKTRNVLKLLGAIIVFLLLLCGILHVLGSSYQCQQLIDKVKDLIRQLSSHTIGPMEALRKIREWLAGAWNSVKDSAPVTGVLGLMGSKYLALKDQIFIAPPEDITPPSPTQTLINVSPPMPHEKLTVNTSTTFGDLIQKIKDSTVGGTGVHGTRVRNYLIALVRSAMGTGPDAANNSIGKAFSGSKEFETFISVVG